ncbi:ABC transporter permease subunit [Candidatus Micrarchaeota archaeon]|nr:ABC transporter permease subunit [Candidatus Micrarchaeota archaeon]
MDEPSPGTFFVEEIIPYLKDNYEFVFEFFRTFLDEIISFLMSVLLAFDPPILICLVALLAWFRSGWKIAVFAVAGLGFLNMLGLWESTIQTFSLVVVAAFTAIMAGIPLGIIKARSSLANTVLDPVLDFMQTLPTLIYLIPAVLFFRIGNVPGVVATLIFAMPPAIRLTAHGIEQVSKEIIEVGKSFGADSKQLLLKIQLPLALPSIMVGINQTIMLSFSMVIIAGFIGAEGLQKEIISGIMRYNLAPALDAGLGVVILAILVDRMTKFRKDRKGGFSFPTLKKPAGKARTQARKKAPG